VVKDGQTDLTCPDAQCKEKGQVSVEELAVLVPNELVETYKRHKFQKGK
jgi:hypothetical protein